MNLSTAIREGAKKRRAYTGGYFGYVYNEIGSCALGAAMDTVFFQEIGAEEFPSFGLLGGAVSARIQLFEKCGIDTEIMIIGPNGPAEPLGDVITELNDEYQWGREAIADWLESVGL